MNINQRHLETNVDWNRVFGVVDSLYSDEYFKMQIMQITLQGQLW